MESKFTFTSEVKLYKDEYVSKSPPNPDTPFCIGILGDFSLSNPDQPENQPYPKNNKVIEIDRDNIDDIIKSFNLSLNLTLSENSNDKIAIPIACIEDFHPDNLIRNTPSLDKLYQLRFRLLDNNTFPDAIIEVRQLIGEDAKSDEPIKNNKPQVPSADNHSDTATQGGLLDLVLDASAKTPTTAPSSADLGLVDNIIKEAVAGHSIAPAGPQQTALVEALDYIITTMLRKILHHPLFKELESTWRGIQFLCRQLETGRNLKLFLINAPKQLLENHRTEDKIATNYYYKLLVDAYDKGIPWSLLIGTYIFDASEKDAATLHLLGTIAESLNVSFISSAHSLLVNCADFGKNQDPDEWDIPFTSPAANAWSVLRTNPVSRRIGLVLPRFILRMPFGSKTSPIDSFDFEELDGVHDHSHFLWGNSAYLVGYFLAKSFENRGWEMYPGEYHQLDNLPLYSYIDDDGDTALLPCAEFLMTERAAKKILAAGLMPLWSLPNQDSVRLGSFRSLSNDDTTIVGPWVSS